MNNKSFGACVLSSVTSSIITHPIDVVKVRVQTTRNVYVTTIVKSMLKNEGYMSFYRGMNASICRNSTFISTKMFTYQLFKKEFKSKSFYDKLVLGSMAGATGAIVGTPFDVVTVRIQNDPLTYPNIFTTMRKITLEKGVIGFWTGLYPNVTRASIITASQLGVYDHLREKHSFLYASVTASVVSAVVSNPFDLCRIRRMNNNYTNTISSIVKKEGLFALLKGLHMSIARQVPLNIVRFGCLEFFLSLLS